MEQVKLEIVDIWHFGMSMLFDQRDTATIAADLWAELSTADIPGRSVLEAAEELATTTLATRKFSIVDFTALLRSAGMDYDELYTAYVSKNVLNFFRQDNGYKEGTYVKNWQGREDNEHLVELLVELDSAAADFADRIYAALARRYTEIALG
jgi:dUTPase